MRTKSAMLDLSRGSGLTATLTLDADGPACQTRIKNAAMCFMACSPQTAVDLDTLVVRNSVGLKQEKGRSGATPPTLSCNCLLAGRFRCTFTQRFVAPRARLTPLSVSTKRPYGGLGG